MLQEKERFFFFPVLTTSVRISRGLIRKSMLRRKSIWMVDDHPLVTSKSGGWTFDIRPCEVPSEVPFAGF